MSDCGQEFVRRLSLVSIAPPKIKEVERPTVPERSLSDWRADLKRKRQGVIGKPGLYLDCSPTGTGKSTADIEAVRKVGRALIVAPTHKNCEEIESDMNDAGIDAMAYPGRLLGVNCWNDQADEAQEIGLSPVAAVCFTCPTQPDCLRHGYLAALEAVKESPVAIATHARAVFNGFDKLAQGREEYTAVHEDAANTVCPQVATSEWSLQVAKDIVGRLLNDPKWLDWLGRTESYEKNGDPRPNERFAERRSQIYPFLQVLADLIDDLRSQTLAAERTQAAKVSKIIPKATGIDYVLFQASLELKHLLPKQAKNRFPKNLWRVLLAALTGELFSLGIVVTKDYLANRGHQKEAATGKKKHKTLVGTWKNLLSEKAVVVFADATANRQSLELLLGHPVEEITPIGHIPLAKRVVQYPIDFSRVALPKRFLDVVRGILIQRPDAQQVGIITHETLVKVLEKLTHRFARRITKKTYFGSGDDRASNDWNEKCDLLIVIGTPRPGEEVVQSRLIQLGDFASAEQDGGWGDVQWRCKTEAGADLIVNGRGYANPAWDRAHLSLVRANLVQAVGRARSLLDNGCDVILVAAEEAGFPFADFTDIELNETEAELLAVISDLSAEKSYKGLKTFPPMRSDSTGNASLTTAELAHRAGLSERQTRDILVRLESRHLVSRAGERGGWLPSTLGQSIS